MTVQNSQNRSETVQTNVTSHSGGAAGKAPLKTLGRDHVGYWKGKLKRRSYKDRSGRVVEVPAWQARLSFGGADRWFSTGLSNRDAAAVVARDAAVFLRQNGWEAFWAKYRPSDSSKDDLTLAEFGELYRGEIQKLEHPPSRPTAERYLKSLNLICGFAGMGVKRIQALTPDKVEDFKAAYLAAGRKARRNEESVRVTCNSILRNAAAVFSRAMLQQYKRAGLTLENPFAGAKLRRIVIPTYTPLPKEKLEQIWRESVELRDGNPSAVTVFKKRLDGHAHHPNWTKAHPDAYLLLLLELGLGLRRNEADKCEWAWFRTDARGQHFLEVGPTRFFTPKSREKRTIPVEAALYEAIMAFRESAGASPFVVPGGSSPTPLAESKAKNTFYRCDRAHRTLTAWLRERGIDDDKPCHALRKEFGSYVATVFGLYVAQKLLGHSSPDVTARFYAGLTQLPELKHARIDNQQVS